MTHSFLRPPQKFKQRIVGRPDLHRSLLGANCVKSLPIGSYNFRKTRRKGDRGECGSTEDGSEQKLYLQSPLLECRIPEPDLIFLSDLPGGLDYNEWLASHSKLID